MNHQAFRRLQTGFSLIESLIVLVVVALTLGAAVPSFGEARQRRHLDGAAAQLETDLYLARSAAVAENRSVRISFRTDDTGSCYVIHTGAAADCVCGSGGGSCSRGETALRSAYFPNEQPVQLAANVASILFDSVKGTTTPTGTLRLTGRDGKAVHVVVNIMGRVRNCSPAAAVPGYRAC